jgi:hypothetical protein
MYKIIFDGHMGANLLFVIQAKNPKEATDLFYSKMLVTDRIKSSPVRVSKSFVIGAKQINNSHWILTH